MTYLLDSNTCIMHLRSGGRHDISRRLRATPVGEIAIPTIVQAELLFGALRSRNVAKNMSEVQAFCAGARIVPFDESIADVHARIRADLAAAGTPIGPYDSMIAATALVHALTLVTHNTGEFSRIKNLKLEDWDVL